MSAASWGSGRLVCLDFESTGVDPTQARIVTAAFVDLQPVDAPDGKPSYEVDRWSALADPGVDIPAEAAEVHGITTDHAQAHGRPPAEVIAEVRDLLTGAWAAGAPVVGHNLGGYDLTLLDRECRRHLGEPLGELGPVIDTLCLDRAVDRYRRGSRKLDAACAHYDVRLDGAHDATEDALAAARIAWRIARRYPDVGRMSLDDLQGYQRQSHAAWAENFEAYLRKRKRADNEPQDAIDAVRIERAWPLRPWADTEQEAA